MDTQISFGLLLGVGVQIDDLECLESDANFRDFLNCKKFLKNLAIAIDTFR